MAEPQNSGSYYSARKGNHSDIQIYWTVINHLTSTLSAQAVGKQAQRRFTAIPA